MSKFSSEEGDDSCVEVARILYYVHNNLKDMYNRLRDLGGLLPRYPEARACSGSGAAGGRHEAEVERST